MKNILCFGDENVYGYNPHNGGRLSQDSRWCGILQHNFKNTYNIIEEGCNARTILFKNFNNLKTCGIDYLQYCLNQYTDIDLTILFLGLNDCQNGYNAKVNEVIDGIRVLIELIQSKQPKSKILIISPVNITNRICVGKFCYLFGKETIKKSKNFNIKLKKFSNEQHINFLDTNKFLKPSNDGLHIGILEHKQLAIKLTNLLPQIIN